MKQYHVRLTDEQAAILEALRGGKSPTRYITAIVSEAIKKRGEVSAKESAELNGFITKLSRVNYAELSERMRVIVDQNEKQKELIEKLIDALSKANVEMIGEDLKKSMYLYWKDITKNITDFSRNAPEYLLNNEEFKKLVKSIKLTDNRTMAFWQVIRKQVERDRALMKELDPEVLQYLNIGLDKK